MSRNSDLNSDPLSLLEDALAGAPNDAAGLSTARGYLRDVATAADEAERPRLSRFASALDALLELVETETDDGGVGGEILGFVRESVDPLRAAVADDPDADERVNAALDFLDSQWGEYLSLLGADSAGDGDDAVWAESETADDSDSWTGEDLSRAQTREEIDRILSSLAAGGEPASRKRERPESGKPQSSSQLFGETDRRVPDEPPPPVAVEMDADLLEAYLDDASAGVGRLEQLVLAVESDPGDESLHRQICRELHTLKGASASVGLSDLAAYLHAVEDYIDASKGTAIEIAPMLKGVDALRGQITTLAGRNGAGWPGLEQSDAPAIRDTGASLRPSPGHPTLPALDLRP